MTFAGPTNHQGATIPKLDLSYGAFNTSNLPYQPLDRSKLALAEDIDNVDIIPESPKDMNIVTTTPYESNPNEINLKEIIECYKERTE